MVWKQFKFNSLATGSPTTAPLDLYTVKSWAAGTLPGT